MVFLFLLSFGTAYAQDDPADLALQKAQAALKAAQAAVDAAVKAKQASSPQASPTEVSAPETRKFQPIDTGLDVYSDGTVGISYSYQGKALNGFQDYANIIYPLNDAKSTNLLKGSQTEDLLAWGSILVGLGLDAYYLVDVLNKVDNYTNNFNNSNSLGPDIAGDTIFIVAGSVLESASAIFFLASQGDFNHAIRRYNKLIQKQDQVSLYFSPNPNRPELGLVQRF
jgi:hypothetical protein